MKRLRRSQVCTASIVLVCGLAGFGSGVSLAQRASVQGGAKIEADAALQINVKGDGTVWIHSASLMPDDTFHGMRADEGVQARVGY